MEVNGITEENGATQLDRSKIVLQTAENRFFFFPWIFIWGGFYGTGTTVNLQINYAKM